MKKGIRVWMILALTGLLCLLGAGCGNKDEQPTAAPQPVAEYTADGLKQLLQTDPAGFDALLEQPVRVSGTVSRYTDRLLQGAFQLTDSENHIVFDVSSYDAPAGWAALRSGDSAAVIAVVHGANNGDIYLKYAFLVLD